MKKKVLASVLALSIATTGAVAAVVFANKTQNESNKIQGNVGVENVLNGGSGMDMTQGEHSRVALSGRTIPRAQYAEHGVSERAETAYTIEATILPEYLAELIELDWSVEFVNPDSEWATGKEVTDYVKITNIGEKGHNATVECLQAFGEQIVIKAVSDEDADIYGTTVCDYIQRYTKVQVEWSKGQSMFFNGDTRASAIYSGYASGGVGTFKVVQKSVSTKDDSLFSFGVSVSAALVQQLQIAGFEVETNYVSYVSDVTSATLSSGTFTVDTFVNLPGANPEIIGEYHSNLIKQGYLWATTGTNDDGQLTTDEWEAYKRYRDAVLEACSNSMVLLNFELTQYKNSVNKEILMSSQIDVNCTATTMLPEISLTNIMLNYGNIDF